MPGGTPAIAEAFLDSDRPRARTTIRCTREPGFELAPRYGSSLACMLDCEKQG
jgi:hypothetical protein